VFAEPLGDPVSDHVEGNGGAANASGGAGGGSAGSGQPTEGTDLLWDEGGRVSAADQRLGIGGYWYPLDDCPQAIPAGLPCTTWDSGLVGPNTLTGWSVTPDAVCIRGTATQVVNGSDGSPAYAQQWGAGVGFDLSNTANVRMPYDAAAHGITGFVFEITGTAPPVIRVNIGTPSTGNDAHFVQARVPSANLIVRFSDVQQGAWVGMPRAFTPEAIFFVQFQVVTSATSSTPFDFCIRGARVLFD
jgi:hypothetical protein